MFERLGVGSAITSRRFTREILRFRSTRFRSEVKEFSTIGDLYDVHTFRELEIPIYLFSLLFGVRGSRPRL